MKKTKLLLPILTVGTLVGTATTLVACTKKQEEEIKYLEIDNCSGVYSQSEVHFHFIWINKNVGDVIEITFVDGMYTGPQSSTFDKKQGDELDSMNEGLNNDGEFMLSFYQPGITDTGTYTAELCVKFKINGTEMVQNFEGIEFMME